MPNAIIGTVNKIKIPVFVDGEELAIVKVNPNSPLIMRDIAKIVKLLNGGLTDDIDLSDEDKAALAEGGDLDALKRISTPLIKIADFMDDIISACDKLFGAGVTELVLANDDDTLSLLKQLFDAVVREVAQARKGLSDKYKA